MYWIILGICSQILSGISATADKIILKRSVPEPASNAFFLALSGLAALVLAPFGFHTPNTSTILFALAAGGVYFIGMLLYFNALNGAEASSILPIHAGWLPIATLAFTISFAPDAMRSYQMVPFALLVLGTLIIARNGSTKPPSASTIIYALLSAVLLGLSNVLSRRVFFASGFISGFITIKIAVALAALIFMVIPAYRRKVARPHSKPAGTAFFLNRVLAGVASVIFFYALSIGNPPILDALRGIAIATIFILSAGLSALAPRLLQEDFTPKHAVQKILGLGVIAAAIAFL